jgi:serine/threonine-protein kinase
METRAPGATRPPGTPTLRGYEVRKKIGSGGMGLVFEGVQITRGRRVAIKQMRAEIKEGERERAAFLKEAEIISHLTHPNIVAFHEVVQEGGDIYLVFDFVDGKTLAQILEERKKLPLAEVQRIFSQVCSAVSCAHRGRVLHRDLKPSNIMIDGEGLVKVMDFGIAREAKDTITRLTRADASGTPAYMAPEQHLGSCGKPSDIYALGVCLYETLTGHLPFPGPDFLAQKERMKYQPPQFLSPNLPKETELLFSATLALNPDHRVADAEELIGSLKSLG